MISVAIHYHQGFDNYRLHTRKKEERDVLWNRNIRKTQLYTLREADYRLCPNMTFIIPNYKNNVTCNGTYDVYHKQSKQLEMMTRSCSEIEMNGRRMSDSIDSLMN